MLEGVDVSTYQTVTPPLDGLSFVFARASYGVSADAKYAMHAANVRAAGLVLGAYHFWYDGHSAQQQVDEFLSVASGADLLCLDYEGAAIDTTGAQQFIALIQASGRKCGLYHSQSGYPSWGQDYRWVARWTVTPPSIPWDFWQYQGSPLDLDRFAGDYAALQALIGDSMDPVKAAPVASCDLAATTAYLDDQGVTPTDPPLQGGSFELYYRAGPGSSSANMPNGAACLRGVLKTGDDPSVLYADDAAISNVRLIGAPPPVIVPVPLAGQTYPFPDGIYEVKS